MTHSTFLEEKKSVRLICNQGRMTAFSLHTGAWRWQSILLGLLRLLPKFSCFANSMQYWIGFSVCLPSSKVSKEIDLWHCPITYQDSCIYYFELGNGSCSIIHKLTGQQCTPIRPIGIVAQMCNVCRAHFLIKQWPPTLAADHWSIYWLYQPLSLYSFTCVTLPHRQHPAYVNTLDSIDP